MQRTKESNHALIIQEISSTCETIPNGNMAEGIYRFLCFEEKHAAMLFSSLKVWINKQEWKEELTSAI